MLNENTNDHQAALAARALERHGVDTRPGKRVRVRVVSPSCGNLALSGRILPQGESVHDGIHENDLPAWFAMLETATPAELEMVAARRKKNAADFDKERREGRKGYLYGVFEPVAFREVMGRDMRPLSVVEVLK